MLRNYFILNLLLILILGVLGFKLYNVLALSVKIPSEASESDVRKEDIDNSQREKAINESTYDTISRLDLFRPSRTAPLAENKKEEQSPLKSPPKLFGTIILKENTTAILEDPDTNKTKVYRVNDSIAGYRVAEILEDKVVLSVNGDKIEVKLRDDKGIKPAAQPRVQQRATQQTTSRRATPQRRSRPVPPRRRPTRVSPPASSNSGAPNDPGVMDGAPEEQQ